MSAIYAKHTSITKLLLTDTRVDLNVDDGYPTLLYYVVDKTGPRGSGSNALR